MDSFGPFSQAHFDDRHGLEDWLHDLERADRDIGAFVELLPEQASRDVARLAHSPVGPLHGVPVGVKELFRVQGAVNGNGSLVPGASRATTDSVVVERLREAGAVVVGTTRSHEFGWGITTRHEKRESTRNPLDPYRVAGGSSGGSAAAVAAGFVPLAIGTDTGGSVRIPAAFCGVLGLKTTLGRISRTGCTALAPSFDTVGLFARSTEVLRRALWSLGGRDPRDAVTMIRPEAWSRSPLSGPFRFASPESMQPPSLPDERRRVLNDLVGVLGTVGGVHTDVEAPSGTTAAELFVPQIMAEASFVHRRILKSWPEHAESYGRDVAARLRAADSVGIDEYLAAQAATEGVRVAFARVFDDVDVVVDVIGSTGPSTLQDPDHVRLEGERVRLLDTLMPSTLLQNLGGLPSLTVPVARDAHGFPVAIQLTGPAWSEEFLLEVGRRLATEGAVLLGR